ncbi:MAG: lipid II flippase MurJ [Streptosporangiaceae bacterium]
MTGPAAQVAEPEGAPRAVRGIGRAAVLIGGLTVLARVVGLGRQIVFAHTVGNACLGTAYATANQLPNIIYDIVLGGALTSIMVPVLARPAERADRDPAAAREVSQISSALLTWTVLILVPVSAALALAAEPLVSLLIPLGRSGCPHADLVAVGSRMLVVFAPQILLYGLAVVMYGILQAHRRFTAPALAPVLSSAVVIVAYLAYFSLRHSRATAVTGLSRPAELILSAGTTAGVAALVVTALVPAWRLRLRLRPALRFPGGVARRARALAAVGIAALVAQDASVLMVTWLANGHGDSGAVVLYGYGWQLFTAAYAVLAIPIAISAFPVLSASRGDAFDGTAASSGRAAVMMSCLGAALLAGAAVPVSRVFASDPAQVNQLALTFAAFAPGLIGYGVAACLSRVLLADGRNRMAAMAMSAGWLLVIAADVAAVHLVTARWVVPVLGLGNTVGLTASGAALLAAVRRARGAAALRGMVRAAAAGLAAALAGGSAAAALSAAVPASGAIPNGLLAVAACACAAAVFVAVGYALDGGDLRTAVARLRRRAAS